MYNLGDDKELDRLSREAAGNYMPPAEANWQTLSHELDKVLPAGEKKRRILYFWWLLPLLLAGGVLTYWLMPKQEKANVTSVAGQPIIPQADKKKINTSTVNAPVEKNETAKNAVANSSDPTEKRSLHDPSIPASKKGLMTFENKPSKNRSVIDGRSSFSLANSAKTKKTIPGISNSDGQQNSPPGKAAETPALTRKTTLEQPADKEIAAQKNTSGQPIKDNTTALPVKEETPTANPVPVNTIPTEEKQAAAQAKSSRSRPGKGFSISLLAGADKSTVKFRYGKQAGINLGIMGGYHFNNRWSIHTGAIYTQKNYKMEGEDFTVPKGSPMSYYKLETVDGFCRMWELPLVARYTINPSVRNTVFISAGLSSYFMTRENYSYFYYYNGQPTTRNNNYISTDTHVLSIAHLSAGFDKKISKSLSLQVEPYAKLPLGGIGLGNIRLSSFGINFSVQYRQPVKK